MPTASVTTSLAQITQYLYTVQINKDNAFGNSSINTGRDVILYAERKALQYAIDQSLVTTSNNYVYALIGAKLQLANEVYSSGSAGIAVTASGGVTGYVPYPINITVQQSQTGSTTLSALTPSDWVGLVLFTECTIDQSVLQLNANFTYNVLTGQFDFALNSNYYPQAAAKFSCNAYKAI